ncbi:MAG: sarcosine oxidase subunit gamma family protein [Pseudomonadota bacterium]
MSDSLQRQHALSSFAFSTPVSDAASETPDLRIEHQPGFDYVNIRGGLSSTDFATATTNVLGFRLPAEPNTLASDGAVTAFWLGPDEWLLRGPAGSELFVRMRSALHDTRSACTAQNGGFEQFSLQGPAVFELLSRASTLDFQHLLEQENACAQSGFAKANLLFEFTGSRQSTRLIVRRSFAEYVALWLRKAGGEYKADFA